MAEGRARYEKEKKASVERMPRIKKHQYSTEEIAAIFGLAVEEVREPEAKAAGESAES
jgi:predicted transposase YdaD